MKAFLSRLFALALAGVCSVYGAEEHGNLFTNADVIRLLDNKIKEEVIIAAIESANTKFDLSSDAIIELTKHGASDKVLLAMTKQKKSASPQKPKDESEQPGLLAGSQHLEVALIENGVRRVITKGGYFKTSFRPMPFVGGAKGKVKFDGPRAAFRITNPEPVFEITLPSDVRLAENVFLVLPKEEKVEREIEVAKYDIAGQHKGKFKTVDVNTEPVATRAGLGATFATYHIKPAVPLTAREYVLVIRDGSVHNQSGGGNYYDFGVDRAP